MGQFRWRGQDRRVVWGIVLLLLLRFVSAATINLSPQEAYYWNYSIHPDLSYLDHPPMVAWVIRAGTLLLGKSEIGVRIGGLWLVVVSTWLINALGRLWFSRRAGLWAALLFQVIPVYFIYGVIITPDAPLICFWLLTIYLVSIAVLKDRPSAWYCAGAALGFAMLSKYTALFLVPSALLFLIADRAHRKWLLRKEPYLAFFLSLVIFSPVILWNYQHQWASFAFQFGRRLLGEEYQRAKYTEIVEGHAYDPELLISHARHSLIEFLGIQLGAIFPTFSSGSSAQFCRCALFYDKRPRLQVEILSVLFIPNPGLFCRVQHRLEGKRQLAPAGLSGAAYCRPYVLSIPALQKRAKVQNCPAQDVSFFPLWLACPLCVGTLPYGAGDTLCSGKRVVHWVAGIGQDRRARESDHRDREG